MSRQLILPAEPFLPIHFLSLSLAPIFSFSLYFLTIYFSLSFYFFHFLMHLLSAPLSLYLSIYLSPLSPLTMSSIYIFASMSPSLSVLPGRKKLKRPNLAISSFEKGQIKAKFPSKN